MTRGPAVASEVVAQQLGIDLEEFENYLHEQAQLRDEFADDPAPMIQKSFLPDPWEEEEDVLADLQDDPGLQGD